MVGDDIDRQGTQVVSSPSLGNALRCWSSAILGLALASCALTQSPGARAQPVRQASVVVDVGVSYQTWDGWGMSISGLPWEWTVLHYLNQISLAEQRSLQDSLFGVDGYNFAVLFPPLSTNGQTQQHTGYEPQNDDADPGHFNWSGFRLPLAPGDPNWLAKPGEPSYTAPTFRAITDLQRYGTVLIYVADAFPDWMLGPGHQLSAAMEPEFVEYVTALPVFVRDHVGYTFPYLALANEPDLSILIDSDEAARLLRMTRDRLRREGLSTQLIAPQTSTLESALRIGPAFLQDPDLQADVPVFATHSYPTNRYQVQEAQAVRDLATATGRRLWLTEYSDAPDLGMSRDDPADTLERALRWAARVQRDLTEMQVNAWFGMYPMLETGHYPADALIVVRPNYADPTRNTWQFSKRYYALAQYTRFIRPGAVRVQASIDSPGVVVVGFVDPIRQTVVLVAVNQDAAAVEAHVRVDNSSALVTANAYRTSELENLACLGSVDVTQAGVLLPGYSITTLVGGAGDAVPSCSP
jgi:O-glycosyl hydrolase